MYIELTPEQRHLQAELRQYFSTLISTDEAKEMEVDRHGQAYRAMIKRMGSDGKLGVGWPKEYGGHGFGPIEQQIFVNEAARADVPLPAVTLQTVGPTLMVYGTEAQKKKFLPLILAGEVHFAIGYSEPEAGTDLAALRTSAVRQGDEYIVNGQKIWTTGGHDADYVWLACRTDPEAAKHKGISILIVDTTDPGYSWTPIILSDGAHHTNATYYNDVRVPVDMLVGEENAGLAADHHPAQPRARHARTGRQDRRTLRPGARLGGRSRDRAAWSRSSTRTFAAPSARSRRSGGSTSCSTGRSPPPARPSTSPTPLPPRCSRPSGSSGSAGWPRRSSASTATRPTRRPPRCCGWLDSQTKRNLVITFGGGVNEVMREQVAAAGLNVPRVPR